MFAIIILKLLSLKYLKATTTEQTKTATWSENKTFSELNISIYFARTCIPYADPKLVEYPEIDNIIWQVDRD